MRCIPIPSPFRSIPVQSIPSSSHPHPNSFRHEHARLANIVINMHILKYVFFPSDAHQRCGHRQRGARLQHRKLDRHRPLHGRGAHINDVVLALLGRAVLLMSWLSWLFWLSCASVSPCHRRVKGTGRSSNPEECTNSITTLVVAVFVVASVVDVQR